MRLEPKEQPRKTKAIENALKDRATQYRTARASLVSVRPRANT